MFNKTIAITAALALTLSITSIAYANEKDLTIFNRPINTQVLELSEQSNDNVRDDMFTIMQKYGYGELITGVENGNYEAMDDFMNNISEEDYQKMIDIMNDSGYGDMAAMMGSIGREQMIEMHNSMGGSRSCHGSNKNSKGMMGGSFY